MHTLEKREVWEAPESARIQAVVANVEYCHGIYKPSNILIAEASRIAISKRSELEGEWVQSRTGSSQIVSGISWIGWWPATTKLSPDQWWIHAMEWCWGSSRTIESGKKV